MKDMRQNVKKTFAKKLVIFRVSRVSPDVVLGWAPMAMRAALISFFATSSFLAGTREHSTLRETLEFNTVHQWSLLLPNCLW